MPNAVPALVDALAAALTARGQTCATAESCTGGLVGALLTEAPGASAWFRGGVICYANEVKTEILGVPGEVLARHGAVSEPVARAMALGALGALGADMALAVTGVAGPDGGTPEKPVGTVWIAWAATERGGEPVAWAECFHVAGCRAEVRAVAAREAILGLLRLAQGAAGPAPGNGA